MEIQQKFCLSNFQIDCISDHPIFLWKQKKHLRTFLKSSSPFSKKSQNNIENHCNLEFLIFQNSIGGRKWILNSLYLVRRCRQIPGNLSKMVLQISQNFIEKNCKKHTPPKKKQSLFFGGEDRLKNLVNNLDTYTPPSSPKQQHEKTNIMIC